MLWQKESKKADSLYVDIFSSIDWNDPTNSPPLHKCDEISLRFRMEGNALFVQQEFDGAMFKYNESLRFAKTKDISLIYANRSNCFLKMQMFGRCLKDIELAKKSGYPEDKMKKLDDRIIECLKGIESDREAMHDKLKLSLEPDEKYPCMAKVLGFERNFNDYPSIVAKEDIDVGQTIMAEKVLFSFMCEKPECAVCSKSYTNFIPCKKCPLVWFCSEECENSELNLHSYECGLKFPSNIIPPLILSTIRRIFAAMNMFSSVEELMNFVEEAIKGDPMEIPPEMTDIKSRYRAFLKFPVGQPFNPRSKRGLVMYKIFKILSNIPQVNAAFSTKKSQRFLMHLFAHHDRIAAVNFYGFAVSTAMAYIDYACTPNVIVHLASDTVFVTTFRPIKKGEHLLLFPELFRISQSKQERQASIRKYKEMTCECTRCLGLPMPSTSMRMDPIYTSLCDSLEVKLKSHQDIMAVIEKCLNFLRKYGHKMWCDAIEEVICIFISYTDYRVLMPYEKSTGNLLKKTSSTD